MFYILSVPAGIIITMKWKPRKWVEHFLFCSSLAVFPPKKDWHFDTHIGNSDPFFLIILSTLGFINMNSHFLDILTSYSSYVNFSIFKIFLFSYNLLYIVICSYLNIYIWNWFSQFKNNIVVSILKLSIS